MKHPLVITPKGKLLEKWKATLESWHKVLKDIGNDPDFKVIAHPGVTVFMPK